MERRLVTVRGVGAALASQLILVSCGGGGGDDGGITNPPPPPPAAVASVTVTLAPTTINVGQTSQATAVLRDAQNNVLTGRTVTWSSSNSAVASVNASSGAVSGVAAGTANIIATSEGRTGQAQVTVAAPVAPPQISGLTITQNGQAANLSQVAGALNLSFDLDLPPGFNGVLTLRVDTAEFHRQIITIPAARIMPGGSAQTASITSKHQVILETTQAVLAINQDEIQSLPRIRNGNVAAVLSIIPNGGQAVTQNVNFTAANPPNALGIYRFDGPTATGTDGKTYTRGAGRADVVFTTYGNEVINGFEVIMTPQAAVYGHDPLAGVLEVIQRIPRTDQNSFILPAEAVERTNVTYILDKITINGVTIDPQVDYFGSAAFTMDLNGDGFADTPQQAQGAPTPANRIYIQYTPPSLGNVWNTAPVRGSFSVDPFNVDNVGPKQTSAANVPVFSYLDRMTTTGGAARWATYGFGASNGQVSSRYEFAGGFRVDRLSDLAGIDEAKTEYYAGPISDQQNLFTPQYKVGTTITLPESNGSRPYTAGVRAFDKLGNYSDWTIRTSSKNAWNLQGVLSTVNLGVTVSAFGFNATRASLNLAAMPLESVWNTSTIDPSLCWAWNVSNSVVGIPLGWLSARARKDGAWGLGAGTNFDQYQVLPSSGSGTTGSATYFTGSAIQQIYSRVGGASIQGLYEFDFKAADNSGLYIGDNMWPRTYKFLYDYTPPFNVGLTYNGTVTAGQPASATLTGTDNYGLKYGRIGIRFDYPSSLFFGGKVFVPLSERLIPPAQGGAPNKNLSMTLMGSSPMFFSFFDRFSGVVDPAKYRSDGTSFQLEDYARNLSAITFAPFSNTGTLPNITGVSSVRADMSSTNWCPGTCNGGGQNIIDLIFNYLDPLSAGPPTLTKAEWFGIPQAGGGNVYRLGAATTLTSVVEGTGRRLSYNLQFDAKTYCGPPGPMDVFVIGYNTGFYLKTNPFFTVNVQAPVRYSNDCLKLNF